MMMIEVEATNAHLTEAWVEARVKNITGVTTTMEAIVVEAEANRLKGGMLDFLTCHIFFFIIIIHVLMAP